MNCRIYRNLNRGLADLLKRSASFNQHLRCKLRRRLYVHSKETSGLRLSRLGVGSFRLPSLLKGLSCGAAYR